MTFILKGKTKLRVFSNNQMVSSIYSVKEDITLIIEEIYSGCVCVKYDINNYGMINIYGDKIVLVDSDIDVVDSGSKVVMYDYTNSINHIIDLALKDGD